MASHEIPRQARRVRAAPPDVRGLYPDPTGNYVRATSFGLSRRELRREWSRQRSAGWQDWEVRERLLPGPLAALEGVAA